MNKPVLILSMLTAVASLARAGATQTTAPTPPPEETKAAPAPASAQVSPEKRARLAARDQASQGTKRPRYLKMIQAEFRAVDLDKKTLSFQTDDGKSYTVEAQVPGRPEAVERAAKLAEVLKPGDRIRMLCRVNEKEEPTLILTLHMVGDTAPMQYR